MSLDAYQAHILEHYKRPRNFGALEDATATARDVNTVCGDDITIHLRVAEDGTIGDILPNLAVLATFAAVIMVIGGWRLRTVLTR